MLGKQGILSMAIAFLSCLSGVHGAIENLDLKSKPAVRGASAVDLAASVKAQVIAVRKAAADARTANLATEVIVKDVFSRLGTKESDKTKAQAVLTALYEIPGIDFVRITKLAAESQPLLARWIARVARAIDPDHASAILTALAGSSIINKTLGTGPGSTNVSANVAVLSGGVVSDEN